MIVEVKFMEKQMNSFNDYFRKEAMGVYSMITVLLIVIRNFSGINPVGIDDGLLNEFDRRNQTSRETRSDLQSLKLIDRIRQSISKS